jgi:nitronate monooxygenase
LKIKNFEIEIPVFQGGMGVGVSLDPLAGAVSWRGGLGIISSAGLRHIVSARCGKEYDTYNATRAMIHWTQILAGGKPVGINVMCAVVRDYEDTIRAAIDAGVDAIISGAGVPMSLPEIQNPGKTALIPIVSSARCLELICRRWARVGYRPDAVVLEGPLAGGHLGFKYGEIGKLEHQLEQLLPQVLEAASRYGGFPVIVAGGIYTHEDIVSFLSQGAAGVQMGTRFLATEESSATMAFKQAVVASTKADIKVLAHPQNSPASPCGMPFRVLTTSPGLQKLRAAKCDLGFLLRRDAGGHLTACQAKPGNPQSGEYLCICNALMSAAGYVPTQLPVYTVGSNAWRVNKILSVKDLMARLCGDVPE